MRQGIGGAGSFRKKKCPGIPGERRKNRLPVYLAPLPWLAQFLGRPYDALNEGLSMHHTPAIWTARRIVALTGILVVLYLAWIGPERFYFESFGTWIVSPAIYPRLLPLPWRGWLLKILVGAPWSGLILQAVPVLMLLGALAAAMVSIAKDSAILACAALGLTGIVFGVYHFLQPFGITLHYL